MPSTTANSARVADAPLPPHTRQALRKAGIETADQLAQRTASDLRALPGISATAADKVERWLRSCGRSLLPPRKGPCPAEWVAQTLRDGQVEFDERQRYILHRRHGLNGMEPGILRDIADELGVTRQRVDQLLKKAEGRVIAHMIHNRGEPGLPPPKTTRTVHCDHCGQPFERPKGAQRRYCGPACRRAAHGRAMRQPDRPYSHVGRITLRCHGCGKRFQRTRYQHTISIRSAAARGIHNPRTYCSRACYLKYGVGVRRKPRSDRGNANRDKGKAKA